MHAVYTPRDTRRALIVAGGLAPFAVAPLLVGGDVELLCPFRAATGLPCPFCGATRAFALAAHGDLGFLSYNAVWVAVAAVLVVTAVAAPRRLRMPPAWALVAVVALGWLYALAQRAPITS